MLPANFASPARYKTFIFIHYSDNVHKTTGSGDIFKAAAYVM